MQPISEASEFTLKFINQTNRSLFLTGKAGTGKTTLLKEIINLKEENIRLQKIIDDNKDDEK